MYNVHLASLNISTTQARWAKQYDIRHMGTHLTVRSKVILQNSREAARKGNKLPSSWFGPYSIVGVLTNDNYTVADTHGKVRALKISDRHVKKYFVKQVVELTILSELPEAPEDVPTSSPAPVAAQASPVLHVRSEHII